MNSKYHTFEINQAKICIYPMKSVRAAYLDLRIRAGSAYEGKESWGALHLLEHMFHEGTQKFNNREEFEIFKEAHGLDANAFTGPFQLGAWVKFPKKETNAALELIDEIMFHSSIPESRLKKEVDVITQEYRDKWSNPKTRFNRAIDDFLYGKNHIATRDGLGQPEFIKKITRQKLITLKQRFLQPQNMVISVAGNVDVDYTQEKLQGILTKEQNTGSPSNLSKKDFVFRKSKSQFLNHLEDVQNISVSLSGSIPSHGYFLIAHPEYTTIPVAADTTYSATSSAITASSTVLLYSDAGTTVVDKVGFGTVVDFEGTALAEATADTSYERKACSNSTAESMTSTDATNANAEDNDNNADDFVLRQTPDPQNSTSSAETPGCAAASPSPTATPEETETPSPTPSPTPEQTETPSPTPTPTPEETQTPEPTPTPEVTTTPSPTPTQEPEETGTPQPTATAVPTPKPDQEFVLPLNLVCKIHYRSFRFRWHRFFFPVITCRLERA